MNFEGFSIVYRCKDPYTRETKLVASFLTFLTDILLQIV